MTARVAGRSTFLKYINLVRVVAATLFDLLGGIVFLISSFKKLFGIGEFAPAPTGTAVQTLAGYRTQKGTDLAAMSHERPVLLTFLRHFG